MKNSKLFFLGLINSCGVLLYISLVVFIMNNGEKLFSENSPLLGGIAILLLFTLSTFITSSLVLGRPIILFLQGLKTEAVKLLIYTAVLLTIITAIVLLTLGWLK